MLEPTMPEPPANSRHQVPAKSLQPLSLKRWTKLLLWIPDGPRSQAQLQKLQDDLANRFEGQWEHAVEYVNKFHDRFLNKARGLLTFDGLVLTALGAAYQQNHRIPAGLVLVGCACAVIAAGMLLLNSFSVHFGDLGKYEDATKELRARVVQIVLHGKGMCLAVVLSFFAMLCLIMAFGIVVLTNG
jgi:hypothetical protein